MPAWREQKMNTTYIKFFASAVACALALSSCGGGDELSGADAELAEALAASWDNDGEFPESVDSSCLANGFVSGIGGADGAAEYGVTAENIGDAQFESTPLGEEDAMAASTNMFKCDGLEAAIFGDMGAALTDEQASCMADNVDDAPLISLVASDFMGDLGNDLEAEFENVFEADLLDAIETCDVTG